MPGRFRSALLASSSKSVTNLDFASFFSAINWLADVIVEAFVISLNEEEFSFLKTSASIYGYQSFPPWMATRVSLLSCQTIFPPRLRSNLKCSVVLPSRLRIAQASDSPPANLSGSWALRNRIVRSPFLVTTTSSPSQNSLAKYLAADLRLTPSPNFAVIKFERDSPLASTSSSLS
jgi:hypothetical protein